MRAYGGWLRELRKDEHGLLLDPDLDVDGDLFGVRLPRRTNAVFPPAAATTSGVARSSWSRSRARNSSGGLEGPPRVLRLRVGG